MIPDTASRTIFVSIASYRDPDCKNTVRDLFEKALYPDRVYMGICLQVVPGEDDDCLVSIQERSGQLRIDEVSAEHSRGACWARNRTQALWSGEDYYLQIDSHMRFVQGWDEKLIDMLAKCPSEKPVLSTYPLGFTPPNTFVKDELVILCPGGFDDLGVLSNSSMKISLNEAPDLPAESFFIGAGLVFTLGKVVVEVPYDPYIYFVGEEITWAVRLWTCGWDLFTPNQVIAYHDYGKRPDRLRHWDDKIDWGLLDQQSRRRVCHLLGNTLTTNPIHLQEIEKYGLGKARSLSEFETASGLDFKAHLYKGQPIPSKNHRADNPERTAQRLAVFSGIWANNSWGNPETRSGNGSAMNNTVELRARLLETFGSLDIRILGDAGCGDMNWMKELTGQLRFYFGYDIVPELVNDLRARYGNRENCFFSNADIVMTNLPECDAILCRDCLTHLPLDAALMSLKRFRQSGTRYLIATTHAVGRNVWICTGGWYAMDLNAPPFNLPKPKLLINEVGTKSLGVFELKGTEGVFTDIYKRNAWGGKESVSGSGSSIHKTRVIIRELPKLFDDFHTSTILDIPCGDFYWMKNVDLEGMDYTGADIVRDLIQKNKDVFENESTHFKCLDLILDKLPKVDLIFCRDCLVHFSFKDIFLALRNICESQSEYLLTTTFPDRKDNYDIGTGQWRPCNFNVAPFMFPKPIRLINEECTEGNGSYKDKSLALWKIKDIREVLTNNYN